MSATLEPPTVDSIPPVPNDPIDFPAGASNEHKRSLLLGRINEGSLNLDILGYLVFWNIREVDVTRTAFAAALEEAGLDPKYAKEHNARSSLIRALNSLKEQKIVKMVSEDRVYARFQFTAELKSGEGDAARLSYHPQVIVTVDKEHYLMFHDEEPDAFRKSITKVDDAKTDLQSADAESIKDQLAAAFERERSSYKSSDITRYVQSILEDEADIVSLRQQGSIYFVPATFQTQVEAIRALINQIGGAHSRFDAIPVPDVKDARKTVGNAFAEEVANTLASLDKEVEEMNNSDKDIADKWVNHRKDQITKIKARIDMYAEVLGEKAGELSGGFDRVSASLKPRVLNLD